MAYASSAEPDQTAPEVFFKYFKKQMHKKKFRPKKYELKCLKF